jgi:hypothetical protein
VMGVKKNGGLKKIDLYSSIKREKISWHISVKKI